MEGTAKRYSFRVGNVLFLMMEPMISRKLRVAALLAGLVLPLLLARGAAEEQAAEDPAPQKREKKKKKRDKKKRDSGSVRFLMRKHPSLRFGDTLRVDLRAKFQGDLRGFSPDLETREGLFDLRRARVGLQGEFLKHFEYEVERELEKVAHPWRDVYVNFRYFRDLQIQVGKFKMPFSMNQLTGPANLDFILRSRIGAQLAPARDVGVMAHGRFFQRGLNYQAGVFRHDGENGGVGGRSVAARLTGTPLRLTPAPGLLRDVELGGAFTYSRVPEGLSGLLGRAVSGHDFFEPVNVHGPRLRLGTELQWTPGPFSVKGEYIRVSEQRRGQGLFLDDLPAVISRGWYVSATWTITGEKKSGGIEPRQDFLLEGPTGAVELAARYEHAGFSGRPHPGAPLRNPRAANLLGNSDRLWTLGVNWYLNRFTKIQFNGVREKIVDTQRSPISGREKFWSALCRLQVVL